MRRYFWPLICFVLYMELYIVGTLFPRWILYLFFLVLLALLSLSGIRSFFWKRRTIPAFLALFFGNIFFPNQGVIVDVVFAIIIGVSGVVGLPVLVFFLAFVVCIAMYDTSNQQEH